MDRKLGIYEFNVMSLNSRAKYLWNEGEFIANSIRHGTRFQLHVLHDFYVEIEYDATINRIAGFTSFRTSRLLDPYLKQIDIDALME